MNIRTALLVALVATVGCHGDGGEQDPDRMLLISPSTTAHEDSVAALLVARQRAFLFALAGSDTSAVASEFVDPDFTLVSGPQVRQPGRYQLHFGYFAILQEYVLVGDIGDATMDVVLDSDSAGMVLTAMPGRCMLTRWRLKERGWRAMRSELIPGVNPDDDGACNAARRALTGAD